MPKTRFLNHFQYILNFKPRVVYVRLDVHVEV